MAERIRVGILYKNDENWIGGTYYIQNLVRALTSVHDEKKPHLAIICSSEKEFREIESSGYPYLSWQPLNFRPGKLGLFKRIINKLSALLSGFDLYAQPCLLDYGNTKILFPALVGMQTISETRKIYWIPDFQEQVLPQFFSAKEIRSRSQSHRFIAKSKGHVVFSSNDAYNFFGQLYPNAKLDRHVLHFAVSHPSDYSQISIEDLKRKYLLDKPYFFVSNQFWKHKNHFTVLKAIRSLVETGFDSFMVAFSGKEYDYRNPEYTDELKAFAAENKLEKNIRFLGFIDRKEQLKLMSEAIAVIQPSLFEGWSTVIEDAKAMGQWIVASDLPVHQEQLKENVTFFEPENDSALSVIMKIGIEKGFQKQKSDYERYVRKFGQEFMALIDNALNH